MRAILEIDLNGNGQEEFDVAELGTVVTKGVSVLEAVGFDAGTKLNLKDSKGRRIGTLQIRNDRPIRDTKKPRASAAAKAGK